MSKPTFTLHIQKADCTIQDYQCRDDNTCASGSETLQLTASENAFSLNTAGASYTFKPSTDTVDILIRPNPFQAPLYFKQSEYTADAQQQQCTQHAPFSKYLQSKGIKDPDKIAEMRVAQGLASSRLEALKFFSFNWLKKELEAKFPSGVPSKYKVENYDALIVTLGLKASATPEEAAAAIAKLSDVAEVPVTETAPEAPFIEYLTTKGIADPAKIADMRVAQGLASSRLEALKFFAFNWLKKELSKKFPGGTPDKYNVPSYGELATSLGLKETATPQELSKEIAALQAVSKPPEAATVTEADFIAYLQSKGIADPAKIADMRVAQGLATTKLEAFKFFAFNWLKKELTAKFPTGVPETYSKAASYDDLMSALALDPTTDTPSKASKKIGQLK